MGIFDLEKAAKVLGSNDASLLDAVGTGFGAPNCIMSMTEDILSLLPSEVLGGMSKILQDARDAANNVTALITKKLFLDSGIIEFDTETGKWKFVGDSSKWGSDSEGGELLESLGAILGALAFGATIYNNLQVLDSQLNDLQACLDKFGKILAANKGSGALASNIGLGLDPTLGSCVGGAGGEAHPAECIANGGEWVQDDMGGVCYGADGADQGSCETNGGTWAPNGIVEPPGGIGSFGPKGPDPDAQLAIARVEMQGSMDFASNCNDQLKVIGAIFQARVTDVEVEGPQPETPNTKAAVAGIEPVFRIAPPGSPGGGALGAPAGMFARTKVRRTTAADWQELLKGNRTVNAEGELVDDEARIFRLEYGPPKAKQGQFLLTIDGLYYDSQTGGVPDVPPKFILPGERYLHEYAPNLGGKGTPIGDAELDIFVNTLFDPDIISEIPLLIPYYDGDHMLQQLISEKNKHINDLNTGIATAQAYPSEGESVIYNLRQSLMSNVSKHDQKINKRKKQIELAVMTVGTYGSTEAELPIVGNIPINDFTYLKDYNVRVALELQKNLTFLQAEVKDVVLPLRPSFVVASGTESGFGSEHIMVPTVGAGGIVYDASTTGDQKVTLLNLTDEIVTDKLLAVYNFQEATAEKPSDPPYADSSKWGVLNCAAEGLQYPITTSPNPIIDNNAKLIAQSANSVFNSNTLKGLSVPWLTGLVRTTSTGTPNGLGSAVRLPESLGFNDLFFNRGGATIETWVYIPYINTSSTYHTNPNGAWGPGLYNRLIVGCENNGGIDLDITDDRPENTFGSENVRGFVMGFSRDRQVVDDLQPSNDADDNPTESMCFFAAPTISYNGSGVGFITTDEAYCKDLYNMYKFKIDLDVSGSHTRSISDVSGQFMHIAYVVEPSSNSMSLYLDGALLGTSAIDTAFGISNPFSFLALPTFYHQDFENVNGLPSEPSFEYSYESTSQTTYRDGPKLNTNTTPWILGGGYTDGLAGLAEGFMGKYHGKVSGLNGHLGSTKFYSKALTEKEVLQNYNAQSPYFKNIDL